MKIAPDRLLPPEHGAYYLHGEDRDALREAAEALLAAGAEDAVRLRVDVSELGRIESESKNRGLFGSSACYALVRNAESANPKQTEHLLKLAAGVAEENRLIICAPEIAWKKALHKKLSAEPHVAQVEFPMPTPAHFRQWLAGEVGNRQLQLSDEALDMIGDRLYGLRLAARQLIERLELYDGGRGEPIGSDIVGELMGERAPLDIEAWCAAVAARSPKALPILKQLVEEQQVAGPQLISWLGTRIQQLLLYKWYAAKPGGNPARQVRLFGEARKRVPGEVAGWKGSELSAAMESIYEAEKQLKGASVEQDFVLLERLTLALLRREA